MLVNDSGGPENTPGAIGHFIVCRGCGENKVQVIDAPLSSQIVSLSGASFGRFDAIVIGGGVKGHSTILLLIVVAVFGVSFALAAFAQIPELLALFGCRRKISSPIPT